jgi:hypothetical protein
MEYPGGGAPFDERDPYPHLCVCGLGLLRAADRCT